jgi:hypothetical protein
MDPAVASGRPGLQGRQLGSDESRHAENKAVKIAVALAIAYLIGGIAYVVGDIGEPVIRQPAYAREYR